MKILRITLQNIASLNGRHTVDFTREPLCSAGLFAISGPTGAGKSSLLDALCLALYDRTPRLNRVGQLAELVSGERQSDPRTLLRRGAVEGYAEVAFIGVDGQAWTAQWHVRRGHLKADGRLQEVAMTLYQGHTEPLAVGIVEVGGKKTAVLAAITEKIGLKFEQFTRAVLLAQNDFATFLKASDKDRAEILQALTGTEQFEAISKSVFGRNSAEKDEVIKLEAKLQGNEPLSEEARAAAEGAVTEASARLVEVEAKVKELETHLAWFKRRTVLTNVVTAAHNKVTAAVTQRDAAITRRQDLDVTEMVSREARSLRLTERQAINHADRCEQQRQQAFAEHASWTSKSAELNRLHQQDQKLFSDIKVEQTSTHPLLHQAREIDINLKSNATRLATSKHSLVTAQAEEKIASERLQIERDQRAGLLSEKQSLESTRSQWVAYIPFVPDAAKWIVQLQSTSDDRQELTKIGDELRSLTNQFQQAQSAASQERRLEPELLAALATATAAHSAAESEVNKHDLDKLGKDRERCESTHQVLSCLSAQLQELQSHQHRAQALQAEIVRTQAEQLAQAVSLLELQQTKLPAATLAMTIAKQQLDLIQTAISDAAKRLRTALQEGKECPVCGSLDHPYRHDQPDFEAAAVKAAKKSIGNLEKERDVVQQQLTKCDLTNESLKQQIAAKQQEHTELVQQMEQTKLDSVDHVEVVAIMALPSDQQFSAIESRLSTIKVESTKIASESKSHLDAVAQRELCRKVFETARDKHQQLKVSILNSEKDCVRLNDQKSLSATALSRAEARYNDHFESLEELWTGIPSARNDFETSPAGFCESFEVGVRECKRIESRIAELDAKIKTTDAAIGPLTQTRDSASKTLLNVQAEYQNALKDKRQLDSARAELFGGRAVDVVEAELTRRYTVASQAVDVAARNMNEARQSLAAANANLKSTMQSQAAAATELIAAQSAMAEWQEQFSIRTSRTLELNELDAILLRDEHWIAAERFAIKQIDDAVGNAQSGLSVYQQQLQEHLDVCPTTDDEAVVNATLSRLLTECTAVKRAEQAARAIIVSDDSRRITNSETSEKLTRQRLIADPWAKLNELIGSSDGAKFRMIAQRRTLDVLLKYANHQLELLATRYRLLRNPESLNLIVQDREMGDEPRSVHSLSGGESFLVSLALALGLASLTSNRLRIESLFIDEGFGSLDPETLNTAMSALMHLEAQGRRVGVISHVTEMTDAIAVQIKVIKGRGGASRLVVPYVVESPLA